MSNFFENIKNLFFKSFSKKKDQEQENQTYNNKTQKEKEEINSKKQTEPKTNCDRENDETSILLEEENNRFQNENYFNKRKLLSTSLIKNKLIPLLYLTFAFSSVAFLLLSSSENSSFQGKSSSSQNYILLDAKNNKKLFNFFKLYNLNPLVFHMFSMASGLLGIFIVYLVQNMIYLKNLTFFRSVKKFRLIEIYLTSFFGMFSQLIHILAGMVYFFSNFAALTSYMQKELNVSLHQFLFCVELFFTVLYGIFVCLIFNKLNKVDVLESESDQEKYPSESFSYGRPNNVNLFSYGNNNNENNYNQNNNSSLQVIPDNLDSKWLNYKIICVIYLVFFGLCYVLLLVIKNDKINFMDKEAAYFKLNQNYLLIFLPYLLYVLNSVFYSLFYGVLKYSSTCHIEFTSQNVYDKSQKNML